MRFKTWPVAALGLGSLLVLIVGLDAGVVAQGAGDLRAARSAQHAPSRRRHQAAAAAVRRQPVRASSSATICSTSRASARRSTAQRLAEFRRANMATSTELRALARATTQRIASLQAKLDDYWQTFDPLFDWTPAEKIVRSAGVPAPRGGAAARSGAGDRAGDRGAEQREPRRAARRSGAAPRGVPRRSAPAAVAERAARPGGRADAVFRLRVLERRSDEQRRSRRRPSGRCAQLSQQLVATQEEERKNLSRELHDHVAQVLTGAADGAGPHRAHAARRRCAGRRGRGRVQAAGRQHVPHRARSRARPAAEHARRFRPRSRRSSGTCATSRAATASTSS